MNTVPGVLETKENRHFGDCHSTPFHVSSLRLLNFRSYEDTSIEFSPSGALICGKNGSGKTNILEAIHLLLTGRSQRGATKRDMIRRSFSQSHLCAHMYTNDSPGVTVGVGLERSSRISVSLNDERISSLSQWFEYSNVVSFSPCDINLVIGEPAERRRYLDLLLSQIHPGFIDHLVRYKRSCANRNKLLVSGASDLEFEVYEEEMAYHGSHIITMRKEVLNDLSHSICNHYSLIAKSNETAFVAYKPSFEYDADSCKEALKSTLFSSRHKDSSLGFSTLGPHRDDIRCEIDGRPAKSFGSRGQCRTLAISFRLAALDTLSTVKKRGVVILVDDAFGDLDIERSAGIYPHFKGKGQTFLTSVSPSFDYGSDLPRIEVLEGQVKAA